MVICGFVCGETTTAETQFSQKVVQNFLPSFYQCTAQVKLTEVGKWAYIPVIIKQKEGWTLWMNFSPSFPASECPRDDV